MVYFNLGDTNSAPIIFLLSKMHANFHYAEGKRAEMPAAVGFPKKSPLRIVNQEETNYR